MAKNRYFENQYETLSNMSEEELKTMAADCKGRMEQQEKDIKAYEAQKAEKVRWSAKAEEVLAEKRQKQKLDKAIYYYTENKTQIDRIVELQQTFTARAEQAETKKADLESKITEAEARLSELKEKDSQGLGYLDQNEYAELQVLEGNVQGWKKQIPALEKRAASYRISARKCDMAWKNLMQGKSWDDIKLKEANFEVEYTAPKASKAKMESMKEAGKMSEKDIEEHADEIWKMMKENPTMTMQEATQQLAERLNAEQTPEVEQVNQDPIIPDSEVAEPAPVEPVSIEPDVTEPIIAPDVGPEPVQRANGDPELEGLKSGAEKPLNPMESENNLPATQQGLLATIRGWWGKVRNFFSGRDKTKQENINEEEQQVAEPEVQEEPQTEAQEVESKKTFIDELRSYAEAGNEPVRPKEANEFYKTPLPKKENEKDGEER